VKEETMELTQKQEDILATADAAEKSAQDKDRQHFRELNGRLASELTDEDRKFIREYLRRHEAASSPNTYVSMKQMEQHVENPIVVRAAPIHPNSEHRPTGLPRLRPAWVAQLLGHLGDGFLRVVRSMKCHYSIQKKSK
jgi:hypothetical protein